MQDGDRRAVLERRDQGVDNERDDLHRRLRRVDNGATNSYTGYATLYLSGTLLVKNSSLCALVKANGTGCTTVNWDPNSRMLVVVANGFGGQVPGDTSVALVSGGFQGALYATWAIDRTTSLWRARSTASP